MGILINKTFRRYITVSFPEKQEREKNVISVNFAYTDYISNWIDMSCAAWGVLSAQNVCFQNVFKVEIWLFHAFNAIAPSSAIFLCWAYFVSCLTIDY